MATGIFEAVGEQAAAAIDRARNERWQHLFHGRGECDECDKKNHLFLGQQRHRVRILRWLERKLGPARYEAIERIFEEVNNG